ncbi:SOS response-associated peptidase [Paenibacillus sp. MBLB4367]|uniref:SOS response-associated peptidase n=1 Tax=Paenibacillus sp. MBLB4367 TaxID=3384767 RepID=UPI00390829F4
MCGRFTIVVSWDELMLRFMLEQVAPPFHRPQYNVAPSQMIMAIINDGEKNRLGELKWGLIPNWAKEEKIGNQMLNARAETIAQKPAFRTPLEKKRCLIPADGFYEWKRSGSGKQPMRITLKSGSLFAMAGLYETWLAPDGRKISSCTIITTTPNELVKDIHDRMPVILRPEDEAMWLNREVREPSRLLPLLQPYPAEDMHAYPVSPIVGNVKNDSPACMEPVAGLL